jgi:hypothetical protein
MRGAWLKIMSNDFLDQLARQLKGDKNAPCRRAIERILALVKSHYDNGRYSSRTEAESDFRRLVEDEQICDDAKPRVKRVHHQQERSG